MLQLIIDTLESEKTELAKAKADSDAKSAAYLARINSIHTLNGDDLVIFITLLMLPDAELEELVESPMARVTKKGGQVADEGTFQPLTLYKAAHNRIVLGVKISRVCD